MAILRPANVRGPISALMRAALYHSRKRRLGRIADPEEEEEEEETPPEPDP